MLDNNKRIIFAQELFETFLDVKNRNTTATRLYVILILTMIFSFGFSFFIALFLREFVLSAISFFIFTFFYFLLINRKVKIIAKYLDWFSFLGYGASLLTICIHNIYYYSIASNAQFYIILIISLLFFIFINTTKKRINAAVIIFLFLMVTFVILILMDGFYWHEKPVYSKSNDILNILSAFITMSSCVFSAYIIGIRSIDDIEQFITYKTISIGMSGVGKNLLEKKDFVQQLTNIQKQFYNHINICIFETSITLRDKKLFLKIDNRIYEKIIKELTSLLKIYQFKNALLILWDLSTLVLITEDDNEIFFKSLNSINGNFNQLIKNKQNKYDLNLKIISKYYQNIDTRKHPRILLEKINEVLKIKYETQNIGKEYLLYKSDSNFLNRHKYD